MLLTNQATSSMSARPVLTPIVANVPLLSTTAATITANTTVEVPFNSVGTTTTKLLGPL